MYRCQLECAVTGFTKSGVITVTSNHSVCAVQAVYDVTSTSMKTPEFVMEEMERVLSDMSIEYKKKK